MFHHYHIDKERLTNRLFPKKHPLDDFLRDPPYREMS